MYTGVSRKWTYKEVRDHSGKVASMMKQKFNVKKGDTVVIYMPMIIEAAFAMLACARIGAIHSVVFGGFSAKELANRIDDCKPALIVTASMGLEPGKEIPYPPIIEEAISLCTLFENASQTPRLICQRPGMEADKLNEFYTVYQEAMTAEEWQVSECEELPATHPLYILYTSGTTGQPKGIVRETGGTTVALNASMRDVFNVNREDVFYACSDIGWVVGHNYIVYGPLLRGATSVFFEGKAVTPTEKGACWERAERYKATGLYMAPTAVRVIKKLDYTGEYVRKSDLSTVKNFLLVGERCDPDTIHWLHKLLPHVYINDTWWQTETGHVIGG